MRPLIDHRGDNFRRDCTCQAFLALKTNSGGLGSPLNRGSATTGMLLVCFPFLVPLRVPPWLPTAILLQAERATMPPRPLQEVSVIMMPPPRLLLLPPLQPPPSIARIVIIIQAVPDDAAAPAPPFLSAASLHPLHSIPRMPSTAARGGTSPPALHPETDADAARPPISGGKDGPPGGMKRPAWAALV